MEFVLSLSYFECKCVWFGRKWRKGEETEKKKRIRNYIEMKKNIYVLNSSDQKIEFGLI